MTEQLNRTELIYSHPTYLTSMQSTSCEMWGIDESHAGIKIAGRNINALKHADPSSGIAGSYGSSMLFFKGSPHSFPYWYIRLYFQQQCKRIPFLPHLPRHLMFVDILMMTRLP